MEESCELNRVLSKVKSMADKELFLGKNLLAHKQYPLCFYEKDLICICEEIEKRNLKASISR